MASTDQNLVKVAVDAMRERLAMFMGRSHGGARNLYNSFGYPSQLSSDDFWQMYKRNDIASRIVRAFPQATWRERPTFSDDDGNSGQKFNEDGTPNANYSEFVESVERLLDLTKALHYLERVDRLSGIGHYGVLLMGFQDGETDLSKPLLTKNAKLIFMSAYSESNALVSMYEQDRTSPRYGMPLYYTLKSGGGNAATTGANVPLRSVRAHWSRVLHIAEYLDENEVFGTPRLEPVYNRLMDLEKVVGASAETFWLNSRGGLSLMADKDATIDNTVLADMKEQANEWEHQLRRSIAMQGVTAQMLSTPIADPKPNVETILQIIAGAVGMPMRILTGSERGELSSSQDENNWAARIDERQNNFATPMVLRPYLQRMIDTGNVLQPKGNWYIEWPDSSALSPQVSADVADKKASALQKYTSTPGAEEIVPVAEFRQVFLGLPPQSEHIEQEEEFIPEAGDYVEGDDFLVPQLDVIEGGEVAAEIAPADTALNGAQIASLKAIVEAVGARTLPVESAVRLILVAFPTVTEEVARSIVAPMRSVTATPSTVPALAARQTRFGVNMVKHALKVNARPRPLYIRRDLLNGEEVRKHFKAQGIEVMLPASEMHCTIVYSRMPIDWFKVGENWYSAENPNGHHRIPPGGARMMDRFGKDHSVLVLLFNSSDFSWRHRQVKDAGGSWDYPDYQPHITISFQIPDGIEPDSIKPYQGALEFGPEIFSEIVEDWKSGIKENAKATP